MDPLWAPACTGYPGADNNADNNDNDDRRDSYGYFGLIVKREKNAWANICSNEHALWRDIC